MRSERRRTASKTLTVPTTLTSAPSGGFARQAGTCNAARWMTVVIACSSSARSIEARSVMSPFTILDRRQLVRRSDRSQAPRVTADVEGDDRRPLPSQGAHGPGPDAAEGARDEDPLLAARRCRRSSAGAGARRSPRQRLTSSPMPSIATVTTSPSARKRGGSRKTPTPAGVPVAITSPGSSVNACEQWLMIRSTRRASPRSARIGRPRR